MKKDKIEIKDSSLVIVIDIAIECSKLYLKVSAPAATTRFKGIKIKGEYSY